MSTTTLTALYDVRADADRAAARLGSEAGVPRADISVIAQDGDTTGQAKAEDPGFLASLKSLFVPDDDRAGYSEAIRRGGFLLTATVGHEAADRAVTILEEHGAVDLDERQQAWRTEGTAGQAGPAAGLVAADARPAGGAGEERIQLGEEQLRVGKRAATAGRVRVRSYVVETPVEEQVTLRNEHVSVEHRTVNRAPTAADEALFADRTIEATETDEEAMVSKTARVVGEVVVGKTVDDRVETIRDTVRRTEVEVEDDRASGEGMPTSPAAGETPARPATTGPRR